MFASAHVSIREDLLIEAAGSSGSEDYCVAAADVDAAAQSPHSGHNDRTARLEQQCSQRRGNDVRDHSLNHGDQ